MPDPDLPPAYFDAARRALTQFPVIVARVELASVSENVTFRVTEAARGDRFALRLHRPGYNSLRELESERLWTAALAGAGVRVQEPIATVSGEGFCTVAIAGQREERYAGMTRWVPGAPLSQNLEEEKSLATREATFRAIGRLAARLHEHSRQWQIPPGFTRPALDGEGLLGEAPRWGRFWEHGALQDRERELLLAARSKLAERLEDYGTSAARYGLIHADLHAENVILHDDEVGVIDFDDTAFGWYAYDLATALIEQSGDADFGALRRTLLSGYRELRAFPAEDEAMLEDFLLLRGMALIGWFHQRPEHAGDAYFDETRRRVLAQCARLLDSPRR